MSAEAHNLTRAVNGLPGDTIGTDTLWQDPLAKAFYSSNPGFLDGAGPNDRPVTAEVSLLAGEADPQNGFVGSEALSEALEAAYLHAPVPPKEAKSRQATLETPLDRQLALDGLAWLVPHAKKGSALRRAGSRARTRLAEEEEIEAGRQQTALQYAKAQDSIQARNGSQQENHSAAAKRLKEREEQAGYIGQLETAVDHKLETVSPPLLREALTTGKFLELCRSLTVRKGEDGKFVAEENSDFTSKLNKRVAEYLQAPSELLNDLLVNIMSSEFPDEATSGDVEHNPVFAYLSKMIEVTRETVARNTYSFGDFSPALVTSWAQLVSSLPPDMTGKGFEQLCDDGDSPALALGLTIGLGQEVMTKTLRSIAGHPYQYKRFIDKLYMFAQNGLDPSHAVRNLAMLNVIELSLDGTAEPMAGALLGTSAGAIDEELRHKAIDLQTTLSSLGTDRRLVGLRIVADSEPPESASIVADKLLSWDIMRRMPPSNLVMSPKRRYDTQAFRAASREADDRARRDFVEYALSPEGRTTTLYGQLLAQRERERQVIYARTGSAIPVAPLNPVIFVNHLPKHTELGL